MTAIDVSAGGAPVPVKLTVCGLPLALSVMLSVPVRVPWVEGLNVALIVQFPDIATLEPQVLVCAKSLAPVLTAMLVMLRTAVPVLLRVID